MGDHDDDVLDALEHAGDPDLPGNWMDLDRGQLAQLTQWAASGVSLPLAWLPPGALLAALPAEPSDKQINTWLLGYEAQIQAAARVLLVDIRAPSLTGLRNTITAAWNALADGHGQAAQALAAACINEAARCLAPTTLELAQAGELQRHPPTNQAIIGRLRAACLLPQLTSATANDHYGSFTCLAAAPGTGQYTLSTSLRALMLATATTRELQQLQTDSAPPID